MKGLCCRGVALLSFLIWAGCATQKAVVNPQAPITNRYSRVFLVPPRADPRNITPLVEKQLSAMGLTVEVLDPERGRRESQGSGFIVDEAGHVLTCAHVLGEQKEATFWLGGERHYATVARVDTNADLALLTPETALPKPPVPLAMAPPDQIKMGQDVYTLGFPLSEILGKSPRLTKGLVSSTVGLEDDPDQMQVSAEVQAGSSGGPLLNADGQLVGVIVATLDALKVLARTGGMLPQNVNFAVKGPVVSNFLHEAGITPVVAGEPRSFDLVKDSVVLVRAGRITPERENENELWCRFAYHSFWDMWWRFAVFHIELIDGRTGKILVKAGQYGDNVGMNESATIRRTFDEIRKAFLGPEAAPAPKARRNSKGLQD